MGGAGTQEAYVATRNHFDDEDEVAAPDEDEDEDEDEVAAPQDVDYKADADKAKDQPPATPPPAAAAPTTPPQPDADTQQASAALESLKPAPQSTSAEPPAPMKLPESDYNDPGLPARSALQAVAALGGQSPASLDKNGLAPAKPTDAPASESGYGNSASDYQAARDYFTATGQPLPPALSSPDAGASPLPKPHELAPEEQGNHGGQRVVIPPTQSGQSATDQGKPQPDQGVEAIKNIGNINADLANKMVPLYQALADNDAETVKSTEENTSDQMDYVRIAQDKAGQFQQAKDEILNGPPGHPEQALGPSHYWHLLSTGQQIMYGIGIALNTLVSAATRGRVPNIAWDYFNDAIKRDTQAQFAKLENAQQGIQQQNNLASQALRIMHDKNAAISLVEYEKASATTKQMNLLAAKTQNPLIIEQVKLQTEQYMRQKQMALTAAYGKYVQAQRAVAATQLATKNQTVTDSRGNSAVVAKDQAARIHADQAHARTMEAVADQLQQKYPNGPGRLNSDAQTDVRLTLSKALGIPPEQLDKALPNRFFTNADWSFVKSLANTSAAQADSEARGSMH